MTLLPRASHSGRMRLGDADVFVHVLPGGKPVVEVTSIEPLLGLPESGLGAFLSTLPSDGGRIRFLRAAESCATCKAPATHKVNGGLRCGGCANSEGVLWIGPTVEAVGVVATDIPDILRALLATNPETMVVRKACGILTRLMLKVKVKYLRARCGVRYWEDGVVNGERDNDGSRIPCRKGTAADNDRLGGGDWCPTIDLTTGRIEGWPEGTTADLHYKVCDDGDYALLDADRNVVKTIDGYVPDIMCPGDRGDGDTVILTIGPDGVIANWRVDLSDFERKEDR